MRFGRKREHALLETLGAMDVRHRAALACHEETERALLEALTALRGEVARRETALADTFASVISTCHRLTEHVEDDRAERRALAAAVDGLSRTLSKFESFAGDGRPRAAPHIVGGSFFGFGPASALGFGAPVPAPAVDGTDDVIDVVDLRDEPVAVTPHHVVEVHCRFGDTWVDGFEVCELIADTDGVRYRLRRRSDGSVLPSVFAAADVREVRDARRDHADAQKRRWSVIRP
jgi:hypothetical protein